MRTDARDKLSTMASTKPQFRQNLCICVKNEACRCMRETVGMGMAADGLPLAVAALLRTTCCLKLHIGISVDGLPLAMAACLRTNGCLKLHISYSC